LLVRSYSAAYSAYRNIVVEVKPVRMQPGDEDVQVRSLIKLPGGAQPVTVDYSMIETPSGWKVYDVTVDGVSLVTTYRSTFAEEVRKGGIDGLIRSLKEKNAPPPPGVKKQQ
jgi:phospholipid transport system substrate-binding protein